MKRSRPATGPSRRVSVGGMNVAVVTDTNLSMQDARNILRAMTGILANAA